MTNARLPGPGLQKAASTKVGMMTSGSAFGQRMNAT
jgi:hypothetical protein